MTNTSRHGGLLAAIFLTLCLAGQAQTPEEKLAALNLTLPSVSKSIANYVPAVRSGHLLFLSGHIPRDARNQVITGKLGRDLDVAAGAAAAKATALALLATLKAELGDLRKVRRIVRVGGFVNCTDDFTQQPAVMNGCSDLLVAVFGDAGRHARSALGQSALPLGAAVEIELVAEIAD